MQPAPARPPSAKKAPENAPSVPVETSADKPEKSGEKPEAVVQLQNDAPSGTMYGKKFKLSKVPFLCDSCRKKVRKRFVKGKDFRALAVNEFGDAGYVWGRQTIATAKEDALKECRQMNNRKCEVYAVGDVVVWDHPMPQLMPWPWISGKRLTQPFVAASLTMLSKSAQVELEENYATAANPKALAAGPDGAWSYHVGGASKKEVMRMALQTCAFFGGKTCRIIALNDQMVAE
jgi:adenylate cyclase